MAEATQLNVPAHNQVARRVVKTCPAHAINISFRGVAGGPVNVNIRIRTRSIYEVILSTGLAAAFRMCSDRFRRARHACIDDSGNRNRDRAFQKDSYNGGAQAFALRPVVPGDTQCPDAE